MWGGFVLMVMALLLFLSPAIWIVWWMLADLGEPVNRRPHTV